MIFNKADENNKSNNKNNIVKRVLALVGVVLLASLYIATLIFAITDDPKTMSFFKASATLTIAVPVLLYAYQLVFRVMKSLGEKDKQEQ